MRHQLLSLFTMESVHETAVDACARFMRGRRGWGDGVVDIDVAVVSGALTNRIYRCTPKGAPDDATRC